MKANSLLSMMLPPLLCASYVYGQVGVNTRNPVGVFHVDGKKDNNTTGIPTLQQQLNDFIITASGSVGIGTVNPDTSAALDMSSIKNKGILIPIITLTSNTDQTTIPLTKTGLLIYNTGTDAGLPTAGYLFWNGTEWRRLDNTSTAILTPVISGLNCSSASLSPGTFTAGTAYTGTFIVPYTGGNGAAYPSAAPVAASGLNFTLQAGTLSLGDGQLVYTVSGTPTASSPSTISVPITSGDRTALRQPEARLPR